MRKACRLGGSAQAQKSSLGVERERLCALLAQQRLERCRRMPAVKRILKAASAFAGITFVAGLPTSMLVTSKFEAEKWALP